MQEVVGSIPTVSTEYLITETMRQILLTLSLLALPLVSLWANDIAIEQREQRTPDGWRDVELPQLPEITQDNTFIVTDFGARTSSPDNAAAIQAALNAVPAAGGKVIIPSGTYLSGPLSIKSRTILHLASGAQLQMLPMGTWKATTDDRAFIVNDGDDSGNDIIIEGEDKATCIIDGQGAPWWNEFEKDESIVRPYALVNFAQKNSHRFIVRNITLRNAPQFNLKFRSKKDVHATVHDVIVRNPSSTGSDGIASHNTDGISVSGSYVNIYRCDIHTGDDNIVLKSKTCYIHVWDCLIGEGHGVSIGSQTGGTNHVIIEDCTFNGEYGFKIKTARDRGGDTGHIIFRNSTVNVYRNPILIHCWYKRHYMWPEYAEAEEITPTTPVIHDILIQNVTCSAAHPRKSPIYGYPIAVSGLPESPITNVTFDNVKATGKKGMLLANCKVYFVNNCTINGTSPAEAIQYKHNAEIH